jgi:predicted PurR-regulated permease PerM
MASSSDPAHVRKGHDGVEDGARDGGGAARLGVATVAVKHPARRFDARTLALVVLAALGVVLLLRSARQVFIPLALALLLSYALEPVVAPLARRLGRAVAAGLVVTLATAGVAALGYAVRDDAIAIVDKLPDAAAKLRSTLRHGRRDGALGKVQQAVTEIEKTASAAAGSGAGPRSSAPPAVDVRSYVVWGGLGVVGFLGQTVMVLFLVFFLLLTGTLYRRKLVHLVGPGFRARKKVVQTLDEIGMRMRRFLLVELATGLLVGLATWQVLWWLGVEQALFWGLAAGALNTIPYFGPVLVAVGLAVVAFVQFGALAKVLAVVGLSLLVTSVEGWLLRPALFGRAAGMNHVAVFVSLLFWGWLWGGVGVLLAVPMTTMLKAVCDRIDDLRPVGELLGE